MIILLFFLKIGSFSTATIGKDDGNDDICCGELFENRDGEDAGERFDERFLSKFVFKFSRSFV